VDSRATLPPTITSLQRCQLRMQLVFAISHEAVPPNGAVRVCRSTADPNDRKTLCRGLSTPESSRR